MKLIQSLEEKLNKLDVKFMKNETGNEEIYKYMCYMNVESNFEFPFLIIVNYELNYILFATLPIMKVESDKRLNILEIINSINSNNVYGSIFIDDNNLIYNIGISIEDTIELKESVINDYINYLIHVTSAVLKELD